MAYFNDSNDFSDVIDFNVSAGIRDRFLDGSATGADVCLIVKACGISLSLLSASGCVSICVELERAIAAVYALDVASSRLISRPSVAGN